jgi:lipopolysaccharide biosynthesis glycosyltransferase
MNDIIPIFIGYDPREAIVFHVCANSIIRHSSTPVQIIPLSLNLLKDYEETHTDGSNAFIYSRFLVPYLRDFKGHAIYIDGDMVVKSDITELWNLRSQQYDVQVVKHDYQTKMPVKYLDSPNQNYPRKNWSSVIIWNCESEQNKNLVPDYVMNSTGSHLHRFQWIDDSRIGELPIEWNWLPDEFGSNNNAKLLHYTLGAPCFDEFTATEMAGDWHYEKYLTDYCLQRTQSENTYTLDSTTQSAISASPVNTITPDIQKVFENILKYRVDPEGWYHGTSLNNIIDQIKQLDNGKVAAVATDQAEYYCKEKGKMYDPILQSFIQGSGGRISTWTKESNQLTPIVIRGITKRKEMAACREQGRDFFYIDTGYFGNGKKKNYHRITKNDVQWFGDIQERPSDRLAATGAHLRKFRGGQNILLAPPSQKLLNLYNIKLDEWIDNTIQEIKQYTDRPIVIRLKQSRTLRVHEDTMEMALSRNVHCLVTFSSIAACEALLYGKPAITLGPNAAAPLCSQVISEIENPKIPTLDEVHAWAAHLAYCQFTESEMRDGTAWRILND